MRNYGKEKLYPHTKTLSSTQVLDYAKDPRDFYAKWVAGLDGMRVSPALAVGQAFAEYFADHSFDFVAHLVKYKAPRRMVELIRRAVELLPKANDPEYEMVAKHSKWSFRATLDDFYPKHHIIVEHKTSRLLWTQEVVDGHDQFTFQEWVFWKKYKSLPKQHIVNWVDTGYDPEQLITTFETKRTEAQLKKFEEGLINKVIAGIEAGNFSQPIF